jgi:hypothetical protein
MAFSQAHAYAREVDQGCVQPKSIVNIAINPLAIRTTYHANTSHSMMYSPETESTLDDLETTSFT